MNGPKLRETLACQGGPLNRLRISVPYGLRWFMLETCNLLAGNLPQSVDGVINLESLDQVIDFSTNSDLGEFPTTANASAYVRKQFVSGEKGLIDVLMFQQK